MMIGGCGFLHALRLVDRATHLEVFALKGRVVLRPHAVDDLQRIAQLLQARRPVGIGVAVGAILVLVPARADTEDQPPVAHHVHGRGHLRQQCRVAVAVARHHLPDAHPLRIARQCRRAASSTQTPSPVPASARYGSGHRARLSRSPAAPPLGPRASSPHTSPPDRENRASPFASPAAQTRRILLPSISLPAIVFGRGMIPVHSSILRRPSSIVSIHRPPQIPCRARRGLFTDFPAKIDKKSKSPV